MCEKRQTSTAIERSSSAKLCKQLRAIDRASILRRLAEHHPAAHRMSIMASWCSIGLVDFALLFPV